MSSLYKPWKQKLLQGTASSFLTGDVRAVLVDTGSYTFSDTHEFATTLTGVAGSAVSLTGKGYTNGVFTAQNAVFTSVPTGTGTGSAVEAVVLYVFTGGALASSPLVAYIDGVTVTPNGGDITINWNGSGIFAL